MITIKVDISNANKYLTKVHGLIGVGADDVIKNATSVGHNLAQSLAPKDTGALAQNITSKVTKSGDLITGEIVSNAINGVNYNIYQEFGTGLSGMNNIIHERARSGLKNPVDGISYNKNISGFGAQPFMYPTFVYLQKNVGKDMSNMIKEAIK